jgi:hypothetical protein
MTTKKRHLGRCILVSKPNLCTCGATYSRVTHDTYPLSYPACLECGDHPSYYIVKKSIASKCYEFRYTAKGTRIRTIEEALKVSTEVQMDYDAGALDLNKFRKKSESKMSFISSTISEFIEDYILPRHENFEDREFLQEFMAPFFSDVGMFAASEIHLRDFIRTFKLKGERLERAQRLYSMLLDEVKL